MEKHIGPLSVIVVLLCITQALGGPFSILPDEPEETIAPENCTLWKHTDCRKEALWNHTDYNRSCGDTGEYRFSCPQRCLSYPNSSDCKHYCEVYRSECVQPAISTPSTKVNNNLTSSPEQLVTPSDIPPSEPETPSDIPPSEPETRHDNNSDGDNFRPVSPFIPILGAITFILLIVVVFSFSCDTVKYRCGRCWECLKRISRCLRRRPEPNRVHDQEEESELMLTDSVGCDRDVEANTEGQGYSADEPCTRTWLQDHLTWLNEVASSTKTFADYKQEKGERLRMMKEKAELDPEKWKRTEKEWRLRSAADGRPTGNPQKIERCLSLPSGSIPHEDRDEIFVKNRNPSQICEEESDYSKCSKPPFTDNNEQALQAEGTETQVSESDLIVFDIYNGMAPSRHPGAANVNFAPSSRSRRTRTTSETLTMSSRT